MQLTPVIAIHLSAALAALAIGPVALWARRSGHPRAVLHRAAGYAWVTLMLMVAITAVFIRDFRLPNIAGYTPIHLLTIGTIAGLAGAMYAIANRNIRKHRQAMWGAYLGGCVVAGLFALLPGRFLGNWLWHQTLGLI